MYGNPTQEVSVVKKCLEEVKAAAEGGSNLRGGNGIIKLDALLPNEIIKYVEDEDFGEAAELQWKAVVEDMYLKQKQGEENLAWKGKVISFGHLPDQPLLHLIQGDDLKSMREFMMRTCFRESNEGVDLRKVFDLILEVVVNENLKAEQIIKKVFVFTDFKGFFSCTSMMPHILLWNICDWKFPHSKEHHPGVTMVSGFSDNLIKSFLDNGGEIGPQALMEGSIATKSIKLSLWLSVTFAL
ncbi:PREDICTED: LOW QUALITY PROTEIN [Prunus dulcis]|uniref:PREDICTED: LOW QUALITY PROTEIN n=1 Tax=Prunus dulcis TaxID=3755 RepID=A0A5E4FR12_PRUDU|nr:PREDICTED: LOW QUALITY PROTEIN [Prunus dulcis]